MKKLTLGLLFLLGFGALYYKHRLHAMEGAESAIEPSQRELISESIREELQKLSPAMRAQILQYKALDPVLLRFLQVKIAGKVIDVANKPYTGIFLHESALFYWNQEGQEVRDQYPIFEFDANSHTTHTWDEAIRVKALVYENPKTIMIIDIDTGEEKIRKIGFNEVDALDNNYVVFYNPEDGTNSVEIIDLATGKIVLKLENIKSSCSCTGCLPIEYENDLIAVQTQKDDQVLIDVYRLYIKQGE